MKTLSIVIKRVAIIVFIIVVSIVLIDHFTSVKSRPIYTTGDIYLVQSLSPRQLYFTATGTTASKLKQQLELQGYTNCTVINGGYFGYTTGGDFQPAGKIMQDLEQDGIPTIIPSTINPVEDPNTTTMVSSRFNEMYLTSRYTILPQRAYHYRFYAGPIIIEQGKILTGDIVGSTHGGGEYYRTFIAYNGQEVYMGVTTQKMTLYQLGSHIKARFPHVYVAVNLDGGPSTSLAGDDFSFNQDEKLPRFFYSCN